MRRRLYFSISLLSASIIAFQLALMQILSISQWNHFAYMIISVAMLGFGASGTALAFLKNYLTKRVDFVLPALMVATGASIALIMLFGKQIFGGFDSYLIFLERAQYYNLIISYLALFVPFFTGALAIGLTYTNFVSKIANLYFSDLFGSAAGGAVVIALFWIFAPHTLPYVISVMPVAAGVMLFKRRYQTGNLLILIPALLIIAAGIATAPHLPMSQYKGLSRALLLPGAQIKESSYSPYGKIDHLSSEALRYAPGLSLTFRGSVPVQEALYINGNWFGPLINFDNFKEEHFLDYSTNALPFIIADPANVLVLDAGTGLFAAHALSHKAKRVDAVEPNGAVIDIIKRESNLPESVISYIQKDSRSFLMSERDSYDLIILPVIESFGGSSGINALKEQYLFTLESFASMWHRLSPDGAIAVTVWMDTPARNTIKMLATLVETAELYATGEPAQHIMAIRSWGTVTYLIKKMVITSEEIDKMLLFCTLRNFDPLLFPGITQSVRSRFNHLQDNSFFEKTDIITGNLQRGEFYKSYDYQIVPATDKKPYFSQFLKSDRLSKMEEVFGSSSLPFLEVGYLIVIITLIQISIAALLFIIAPLFFLGFKGRGKGYSIVHFSGIGLGFMFIEIVLIQKLTLYFGHPIYAATAVLSGMLFFSGLGAFFSNRIIKKAGHFAIVVAGIVILAVVLTFTISPLLMATISAPIAVKAFLSILITAPLSFLMGTPFPYGIGRLSGINSQLIPWAWGINGSFSVISTALATVVAVQYGFTTVMLVAAFAYMIIIPVNLRRE